jgi:LmbE family N-acetylglucosaminyl deacetylase
MEAAVLTRSSTAPPVIDDHGGTPEAIWRAWSTLADVPAVPLRELCPAGSRLVVLAPHPDDEILACGGLLAQHVALGGQAVVMAATDGEASHRPARLRNRAAESKLGALRREESAEGLRRLMRTACATHRLGLPDGALGEQWLALSVALVKNLRPGDVVVTTWQHDAHPDHEACGHAARDACAITGCRLLEAPVWMWHWSEPGDSRVPWHRLAALTLPSDLILRKQYALSAHASQLTPRSAQTGPVLGSEIVHRLARSREYFFI